MWTNLEGVVFACGLLVRRLGGGQAGGTQYDCNTECN